MTRKFGKHLQGSYGTAVSTVLGLISSAYRDLHHWRWNQQTQNAEAEILPLGHQSVPDVSDTKSTSHGKNARPRDLCFENTCFRTENTATLCRFITPTWEDNIDNIISITLLMNIIYN